MFAGLAAQVYRALEPLYDDPCGLDDYLARVASVVVLAGGVLVFVRDHEADGVLWCDAVGDGLVMTPGRADSIAAALREAGYSMIKAQVAAPRVGDYLALNGFAPNDLGQYVRVL